MVAAVVREVIVIGGGLSGIGVAIKLDRAGCSDFLILEEGDGVGGAWHWNTYPGVAVDIPSFSYQFSFEKHPDWSRVYAPGSELKAYAQRCADKYRLCGRIHLNTRVTAAHFDESTHVWRLATSSGSEYLARHVVLATGVLSQPKPPAINGLTDYRGTVVHTARWDHTIDLRGKRVGVIGTGASAVQLIPSIAPEVEQLVVFQRTPIWCFPKLDATLGPRFRGILRYVPGAQRAARLVSQIFVELGFPISIHFADRLPLLASARRVGDRFLQREVSDPVVRDKLTPLYAVGCKRPTVSNHYLRTFNRSNVHLETSAIEAVTTCGVRTVDGTEHPIDVLVLATGFKVFEAGNMPPFPITAGHRDLGQWWDQQRYQAYQGVSVPGFPNLFAILGPYGYNGSSYFNLIETQSRHIVRCLRHAQKLRATRIEVTEAANTRYWQRMLKRRKGQVFYRNDCSQANSYYFDKHGDVPFRPALTVETMWESATYNLNNYTYAPATTAARPTSS
ncbi:NAD(P)/FAD-dependent oxidoreductase [Mycobacteroides sp. LB1]|uniref:flavin-containing monooxygenase n=1 Tax=Mycobacteroides sp. LB1 TaxID=2750814 RepID=UPI0015DF5163|nr:NAD(P)/FAD-dependent oxidoreductase [Mycobacteroides sp. LB1]